MTDVWSRRADAFRESPSHREGRDLDLLVEWAEGETALDVATGGGHVGRRLRDRGLTVVTCDPAPAMQPDVICRAEDLPFADESFDVVACRRAAHHFEGGGAAVAEMARVARRLVLVADLLYEDERYEEAHRVRDPTHVRSYSEEEWRALLEGAGFELETGEVIEGSTELGPWLERVECFGQCAERVRGLLAHRLHGDTLPMRLVVLKGRNR